MAAPVPLTADTFEPHLGTNFRVGDGELTLTEVEKRSGAVGGPRHDPFSLVFELAPGTTGSLDQRIHSLHHDVLGALEVFLVPIGPTRYQAIFN